MRDVILHKLREIEGMYGVKILCAVESGSRAWGFPSEKSDFDVRFIYIHPPEWYLSIDPQGIGSKRDVIEMPINDRFDISGWEMTKALRLFRKSNPPLLEWIASHIVYFERSSFIGKLRSLELEVFHPTACLHHYLNIAKSNYQKYLKGTEGRVKIYLYVLRSVLACKWIERYKTFPPLKLHELIQVLVTEGKVQDDIQMLLKLKMSGDELIIRPQIKHLYEYLEGEINHIKNVIRTLPLHQNDPTKRLDELFRDMLEEIWSKNEQ